MLREGVNKNNRLLGDITSRTVVVSALLMYLLKYLSVMLIHEHVNIKMPISFKKRTIRT